MSIDWGLYLYYDVTSPSCLRWLVDIDYGPFHPTSSKFAGEAAGIEREDGYFRFSLNGERAYAHRVVWELFNGKLPKKIDIDHIDGVRGNNRLDNLRAVTRKINLRNTIKCTRNTSGVAGVSSTINQRGAKSFRARWVSQDGKDCSRSFSAECYGEQIAFALACDYRAKMLRQLNLEGAGYTDRHGL